MGNVPKVLVTDADRGSAVAIIRSLGRKGLRVVAADSNPRSIGFRSRYASERLVYPRPEASPRQLVEVLLRTVIEGGVDLVIPVTDEVIQPLAHSRERFEQVCRLAIADNAALKQVTDKHRTLALAERLGIPVPATRVVGTVEEAREAAPTLGWPVVLKPAVSRCYCPERDSIENFSVSYAEDIDSLTERMRPFSGRHRVLLQEYCPGQGVGVELLAWKGRSIAAFQHRRLAELPLTGGRSAWRESVPLDPELYRHATRLVEALSWTGLIMVEFKVGARPWLMEVNGRIWGSLPLAVLSGMDFPSRLAEMYLHGPPAAQEETASDYKAISDYKATSDYKVHVRAFNLELILPWMGRVLVGRSPYRGLPVPKRRQALGAFLGLLSPKQKLDLSSSDDPGPARAQVLKTFHKLWGKSAGRLLRRGSAGGPGTPDPESGWRRWLRRAGRWPAIAYRTLRSRFLYRSLDAVLTAPKRPGRGMLEHLRRVFSPRSMYYDRITSLACLTDRLAPGSGRKASALLFRPGLIPFHCERVELVSAGSGSSVFLIETRRGRFVLKAYRRTIGEGRVRLVDHAARFRERFETVRSWYSGPHDIVALARFLIVHGPLLKRAAVACLQPYIEGEKHDFLADYDDGELVGLLKANDRLREQFTFFARRTLEIRCGQALSVDCLGAQNLMLTRDAGSWRLKLIDYGIQDLLSLQHRKPATYSRIARNFSRLQSLLEAVSLPAVAFSEAGSAVRSHG